VCRHSMGLLARLNAYNPLPTCAATHALGIDGMGLGFVACSSDCYAASITDAVLAVHCAVWALRVWRRAGASGPMRLAVLSTLVCNSLWCVFGALVWLQLGGSRDHPFDFLFRLFGVSQACLVFSWWCVLSEGLRGIAGVPARVPTLVKLLALMHAGFFCLRNLDCRIEDYVLCGGAHVTPPLGSLWLLFVMLCRRHSLWSRWRADGSLFHPPHNVLLGAMCGLVFWVGNSAILVGANSGLTYWSHYAVQALWRRVGLLAPGAVLPRGAFEEMACFHFYGMLGNEMLFRAFAWLAVTEAQAVSRAPQQARPRVSSEGRAEAPRADRSPAAARRGVAAAAPGGSNLGVGGAGNGVGRVVREAGAPAPLSAVGRQGAQAGKATPPLGTNGAAAAASTQHSASGGANGVGGGAAAQPHGLAMAPSGISGGAPSGIGGAAPSGIVGVAGWHSSPEWLRGSRRWLLAPHPSGAWLTHALGASVRAAPAHRTAAPGQGIKEE
jgi:hypothetical protein